MPVAAAIRCEPDNNVSVPCEQLNDYIRQCSVVCPDGRRLFLDELGNPCRPGSPGCKGHGGCTQGEVGRIDDPNAFADARTGEAPRVRCACQSRRRPWCTTGRVSIDYVVPAPPQTRIINYTPAGTPCCEGACRREVAEVLRQLQTHEDGHVRNFYRAAREATADWRQRPFEACGRTREAAQNAFVAAVRAELDVTDATIKATLKEEPPQARPIQCEECKPGRTCCNNVCCAEGQVCCDGRCQAVVGGRAACTCPPARVCPSAPGGCCAEGSECCEGRCCPADRCCPNRPFWPCCPEGTTCCGGFCSEPADCCNGEYCPSALGECLNGRCCKYDRDEFVCGDPGASGRICVVHGEEQCCHIVPDPSHPRPPFSGYACHGDGLCCGSGTCCPPGRFCTLCPEGDGGSYVTKCCPPNSYNCDGCTDPIPGRYT